MNTIPKHVTTCGQNVTLMCHIVAENELNILKLHWMDICKWQEETNRTDFKCNSTSHKDELMMIYDFSLTILNVQPKHMGTYHCKLHAREGMKNNKTILRVRNCVGDSSSAKTSDEATCTFKDVFPEPSVKWSRDLEIVTDLAQTSLTNNTDGLFTAVSTIKLQQGSSNNYSCSLVMPFENEMSQTVVKVVKSLPISVGYMISAHWIRVMLAIVLSLLV